MIVCCDTSCMLPHISAGYPFRSPIRPATTTPTLQLIWHKCGAIQMLLKHLSVARYIDGRLVVQQDPVVWHRTLVFCNSFPICKDFHLFLVAVDMEGESIIILIAFISVVAVTATSLSPLPLLSDSSSPVSSIVPSACTVLAHLLPTCLDLPHL